MAAISVSDNGRYFTDEDGRPFFWLGDTQWELFRLLTPSQARTVLEHRKRQGFNVFQVMVSGVGDGTGADLAGNTPWADNDPARPCEAYFRNVDEVVKIAGELDLILVLGVYHQLHRNIVTTDNARRYARWLAARYSGSPHVIWTMYPEAKAEYVPVCRELAAGLEEGDTGRHLISLHPDPSPTSSSFIHDEPWLAFNMIQTCVTYEMVYEMVAADYALTPVKPVVMAEGGYEGLQFERLQTALEIRKQAYWTYLAGGWHSYGHNEHYTAPADWTSWIDAPGAKSLGVLKEILTSLPEWWTLVPDQAILGDSAGEGLNLNVAARHEGGRWIIVYLVGDSPVTVSTGALNGDTVAASWLNPETGSKTAIGTFPNEGPREFTRPASWKDALILLEQGVGAS